MLFTFKIMVFKPIDSFSCSIDTTWAILFAFFGYKLEVFKIENNFIKLARA